MRIFDLLMLTMFLSIYSIAFAYFNYVFLLGQPIFPIPPVSLTWVYKPANWISRQLSTTSAVTMSLLNLSVYLKFNESSFSKTLLMLALTANSSLGILSAFCMDPSSPECLSSDVVHVIMAVLYFMLNDVYMIGLEFSTGKSKFRGLVAFLSILVNILYIVTTNTLEEIAYRLGLVEWIGVVLGFAYLISFVNEHLDDVHLEFIEEDDDDEKKTKRTILWSPSNRNLTFVSIFLAIITLGVCLTISWDRQDFAPFPFIPEISDLFVLPPGNGFARLLGVVGCNILYVTFWQFYHSYKTWVTFPIGAWTISILSIVALSTSMCISKVEDEDLHWYWSTVFFISFQSFQVWLAALKTDAKKKNNLTIWLDFLTLLCLITKIRLNLWDYSSFAILEFIDVISILLYVGLFCVTFAKDMESFRLTMFRMKNTQEEIEPVYKLMF